MPTKVQLLSKKNRLRYAKLYLQTDYPRFRCQHNKTPNFYKRGPSMGYSVPKKTVTFKHPKAERADPKVVPAYKKVRFA